MQTSLQIIKMNGKVELGRQLLSQLEIDLKGGRPNANQLALKKRVTEFNTTFTRQDHQLSEMQD